VANRIKVQAINKRLADYCRNKGRVRFLDINSQAIDTGTGLSKTGWIQADDIHPSLKYSHALAKLCIAAAGTLPTRRFVSSIDDNRTGDAASLNISRRMPNNSSGPAAGLSGNINNPWTSGGTVAVGQLITGGPTAVGGYVYYVSAITTGTLDTVVPSHTSGSAVNGGATLDWVATSSAGIYTAPGAGAAQGYTISAAGLPTNGAASWVAPAPDGVGFAAVIRAYVDGNNDSISPTQSLTLSDLVPGETVDIYVSGDKSRMQVQTDTLGKIVATVLEETRGEKKWLLLKKDGAVTSSWIPIARVSPKPDGHIDIR
jgi:hypothetical protein